tara:strand:+ start:99 stop:413 length:315 start_codon:yes stop_codon:yes gene_type:complete
MYQGETINPGAKRTAQRDDGYHIIEGEQMLLKPNISFYFLDKEFEQEETQARADTKCPNCFGDGWIPIIKVIRSSGDYTYSELEDVGEEDCPECNGTGEEKIYA